MRILMISHLYPSPANGVYGSFVHAQVRALQGLGCSVRVMAPMPLVPFPLYLIKANWRRFHGIPRHACLQGVDVAYPRIIRTPGAAFFQLAGMNYYFVLKGRVNREHAENPFDLIHAQVAYPDGWAAAKLAEAMNLPLVLTLHGQELQKIVHWSKKLNALVRSVLGRAAAVVVPSAMMYDLARHYDVPAERLHLVYNGMEPLPPAELPEHIRAWIAGRKVLLSVSRLEPEKGIQHNLAALGRLKDEIPDLIYIVVGEGSLRGQLQKAAESLGIQDRVLFAGLQRRQDIQAFYANSHLFSLPSIHESFGIVYLEAMAASLPVIATHGEGIAPLVQKYGVGRLVPPGDIPALTRQIKELLNPALAHDLGSQGRDLACRYTWQRNARAVMDLYASLL